MMPRQICRHGRAGRCKKCDDGEGGSRPLDAEYRRNREITIRQWVLRGSPPCEMCGKLITRKDVHVDHIVPRIRGGTHHLANLRVVHAACNLGRKKKGRLIPRENHFKKY